MSRIYSQTTRSYTTSTSNSKSIPHAETNTDSDPTNRVRSGRARREKVKPEFIKELRDLEVNEGDPARLKCKLKASPKPTIEWLVDDDRIRESRRIQFEFDGENAVLFITATYPEDEGEYTCKASNLAGTELTRAELIVNAPAKITKAAKAENTNVGESVTLKCEIAGNPIPTASWSKNNTKIKDGGRFSTKSTPDFVQLVITSLEEGDAGDYKCIVSNGVGQDSCTVKLTVAGGAASGGEDDEDENLDLPKRNPVVLKKDKKYEDFYDSAEELGKGKFGVVRKCKEKKTGKVFAAKFIRTTSESRKEVVQEMEMMNLLHSKRLIFLQDAFERPKEMIIVLEFIAGGELFEKVCAEDNLSEKDVVRYMRQILQGVQHMHKQSMVHLDLKPENVLCVVRSDGKEDLKLIDFGMAKILKPGKKVTAGCGTPEFVAPEALAMDPISLASDMWSVGVIAYVLLSGLSPFMGDDDNETMNNVAQCEWDFEDEAFDVVSDMSKKFIEALLILDPKKRLTVDQCLNHEWFSRKTKISGEKLSTDKLKQFMARRRWIKTANALRALSRMGNLSGLLGGSKASVKKAEDKPSPQLSGKRGPTISAR